MTLPAQRSAGRAERWRPFRESRNSIRRWIGLCSQWLLARQVMVPGCLRPTRLRPTTVMGGQELGEVDQAVGAQLDGVRPQVVATVVR
jgi:hypothetical protein